MSGLDEMRAVLERLTLEVREMGVALDKLFKWVRHCPVCGNWMEKDDPKAPWICKCGWRSE